MNKASRLKMFIFAASLVALLSATLCACSKDNPVDKSACYDLVMSLDGDILTVQQEILYCSEIESEQAALRIYANGFDDKHNSIDILSAKINGLTVDFDICGDDRTTLTLNRKMENGRSYLIDLEYVVKLDRRNARLGITSDDIVNLSCFYPIMAYYENGEWRTDAFSKIGDPFLSETASYFVTLTLDRNLEVACSGKITDTSIDGERKTVEIVALNVRDFAACVGRFDIVSAKANIAGCSVDVTYAYTADKEPFAALERACKTIEVFSAAFGNYPYDSFCFAQSKLGDASGMEYGAFAIVETNLSSADTADTITHEIAHQWWFGAVGSDQINQAWLDEGLAEFCTYYYYSLIGEKDEFSRAMSDVARSYTAFNSLKESVGFDGRMNRPLYSYLTNGEYATVCYLKGALLFDTLRTVAGDEKFLTALSDYAATNLFGIATPDSLAEAFDNVGVDVRPILSNWTEDKVI